MYQRQLGMHTVVLFSLIRAYTCYVYHFCEANNLLVVDYYAVSDKEKETAKPLRNSNVSIDGCKWYSVATVMRLLHHCN